ncbi:hypothetical protein JCM19037_1250 [Geomicrobium sp. JCM 19037]|uniref:hypothetical protein n=1 Tax=Geomicrobium sp. JCM 19037 TaxID=1460634 RepID=UPI00045F1B3B|nr:hypothetical protein [Geomicrobium sp. JCM 19037]GAK02975.1 hypothetical protein JCM19037_1250 [Geomicrobium sp. JCM 19037]
MTNPNGTNVPVVAQDIEAGATEAVFEFETPLSLVHAGTWTVNGVEYVVDFGIVSVETLDNQGQVVEVVFNAEVDEIAPNNLVVRNANTRVRQGVEDIEVNGNVATVQFVESQDGAYLEALTPYEFTLTIPGFAPATYIYERPAFLENVRAVDSDASNGTVIFGTRDEDGDLETWTVNAQEGTDFETILGTAGTVAFNSDRDIVDFFETEEDVLYGAVTDVEFDGDTPVEIELNGEWYDLESGYTFRYQGDLGTSLVTNRGEENEDRTADYAKFVLNSSGEVAFYDAYDWSTSILVEEVTDEGVVTGFGLEEDLSDYTIVESGQTIGLSGVSRGDNLYYNTDAEYAEVYNDIVVGEINRIFAESIVVDGTEYNIDFGSTRYIDENGDVQVVEDATVFEQFEESGEPVSLYLNREGEITFVLGDLGDLIVGEDGAFLTADANAFTQGSRQILELSYTGTNEEDNTVALRVDQLTTVGINGTEYRKDRNGVTGFSLTDVDATAGTATFVIERSGDLDNITVSTDDYLSEDTVIEINTDSDDNIVGFNVLNDDLFQSGTGEESISLADVGQNFLNVGTFEDPTNIRVYNNTPVFLYDDNGVVDVYSWSEIEDFDTISAADVYHSNNNAGVADYLAVHTSATDVEDGEELDNAVIDRVWLSLIALRLLVFVLSSAVNLLHLRQRMLQTQKVDLTEAKS